LELSQIDCLAKGKTLSDLFVGCSIVNPNPGETCYLQVDPDPTTQIIGVKFDNLNLGDGQCQTFSFTLDESALQPGFQIGVGCVVAATKAGPKTLLVPIVLPLAMPVCKVRCVSAALQRPAAFALRMTGISAAIPR
jgi:hypothetical protein